MIVVLAIITAVVVIVGGGYLALRITKRKPTAKLKERREDASNVNGGGMGFS